MKFGYAFRALKNANDLVNYRYSGEVLKIFSKHGDEIAKVIDGQLQPVKFLNEGEEIAELSGHKLLRQGDEVGFKATKVESSYVKNTIQSKVVKQISYWDKNLNKLVEVSKYNASSKIQCF